MGPPPGPRCEYDLEWNIDPEVAVGPSPGDRERGDGGVRGRGP